MASIVVGTISEEDIQWALAENAGYLFNKIMDVISKDSDAFSDYSKFIIIGANGELISGEQAYRMNGYKYIDCYEVGSAQVFN